MQTDFRRIAIINRGEPAMRIIHAVRVFNLQHNESLATIALYTDPDRHAPFVREADEGVDLGPATFVDPHDGQRRTSYLDFQRVQHALATSGADAAWVGWGFLAERPDFVDLCDRLGVVFIGPDAASMRRLGDKVSAKRLAEEIGLPVVPWGGGPAVTLGAARAHARRLGYPVIVKASAGAGGRGIRRAQAESDLADAFISARQEAGRSFGDPTVFVERWLPRARHIEVQVQGDHYERVVALGVRECTVQRRFQKLVAEAPSPSLDRERAQMIQESAVRLCAAAGYRAQGTVEFLLDPASGQFAFMEVNPRLQVEHAVTEATTGIDLVKLQLEVARGGRLDAAEPVTTGHAIEVRLNAEDPYNNFAASPGHVDFVRTPTGPGLRLELGVSEGDVIPPEYDAMLGHVAAGGHTRDEALGRLQRALADCAIVISGGTTNRSFLRAILERPEVRENQIDVAWLDSLTASGGHVSDKYGDIALIQAAIEVYDTEFRHELQTFFTSASRLRPVVRADVGRQVEISYRGHHYQFVVYRAGAQDYRLEVDGQRIGALVERVSPVERWLTCNGRRHHVVSTAQGYTYRVEVEDVPHVISRADAGIVRANSPAMVVAVLVQPGQHVAPGTPLAILEAMKMEMPVLAPFSATVRQVLVMNNAQVASGAPLVDLDPTTSTRPNKTSPRLTFDGAAPAAGAQRASRTRALLRGVRAGFDELKRPGVPRVAPVLQNLRRLMLGFDVSPQDSRRLLREYTRYCQALPAADDDLNRWEEEVLAVFVDVAALFARQPGEGGTSPAGLSPEQYLLTYLRTLDARGADLPDSFVELLGRALAHHGVTSLDPTPELREALLWIFKSHHRADQQAAAVQAVFERRVANPDVILSGRPDFRVLVDRVIDVSQGRYPALNDLARELRYRYFDQPAFERLRASVYSDAEWRLALLAADPFTAERAAHIEALVECPQPLKGLLADRFDRATPAMRQLMLEVFVRRYYRIRALSHSQGTDVPGRSLLVAGYDLDGQPIDVVATHGRVDDVGRALADLRAHLANRPAEGDVVLELYLWQAEGIGDPDVNADALRRELDLAGFERPVRRVTAAVAGPGPAGAAVQYFTFRPSASGYREEGLYRGLHPMIGKRLDLWRLRNFFVDRLPSVEDVYLFRGVARENAKDERLFAIAEVRDVTPVRDAKGRVAQLPQLERMAMESFTAIRRVQVRRTPSERLHWNRVLLYVRPPLRITRDEMERVAIRLGAGSEGLGLEKVVIRAAMPDPATGTLQETIVSISRPEGQNLVLRFSPPGDVPIRPLNEYKQKVLRMRQRGLAYPYEVIRMLTPVADTQSDLPPGDFVECDLDATGQLVPVDRPYGQNKANIVVGIIRNVTAKYPEGMTRVVLLGDPSKEVGSLAEPECARIIAALDMAERMQVPLEWFALSAGAKISMESGTENMDWIAKVLRRLIEFTQAGHEVNEVIMGINVGGQPYWNAEATMLMHTRGILIMTPEGAMVLTGKTALDYSGSVSAEDNQGIGGYEHIMGPNGQAQYWARDLAEACRTLLRYYAHTYVVPGERFPRRACTHDDPRRDVRSFPHDGIDGFDTVGEVFSDEKNAGRKKPFDIRRVMRSVTDQDHAPLERWVGWRDAEIAVTWEAHVGGYPVCLLGFESRPVPRLGLVATDGPEQWTSGTLFPMASKKVARSINAASGNRPLVILANLSGFDGSPESMRRRQLEWGAEIGRAVVNFKGPIVFVVISRYHGGAFVVFSKALAENMEVAALEGTFASVIGGAPAAAVVFSREVDARTRKDPRVQTVEKQIEAAGEDRKAVLRVQLSETLRAVRSEKLGQVADEFDRIHSVHRALKVGSLDRIIKASDLRPYLIEAIERGITRELQRVGAAQST
jgi:acetyl/propionyl-CoA carboxylase alpha subunit/acetyl-CoA carboxylase carboxyltransferase component